MHRKRLTPLLVGLLLAGVAPLLDATPAHAVATQHVVTTTDDVVDAGDGVLSLREAVTAASTDAGESEIVLAAAATYHLTLCAAGPPEHDNVSGDLDLAASSDGVVITGNGATIDQDCADQRVLLTEQPITLRNVTITGGDNHVYTNGERNGAGVYAYQEVAIEDSTFTGLHSYNGASVYAGGSIDMTRSVITGNTGDGGTGGMTMVGVNGTMTVTDSLIHGNIGGSSVALSSVNQLDVSNTTITGNHGAMPNIYTSIIYANDAMHLEHTTVVGNTQVNGATLYGGELVEVESSILVNGSAWPECHAQTPTTTSLGGNVVRDATCGTAQPTDQTGVADAQLGALADNGGPTETRLPLAGSPVVDAVPAADCTITLLTDQRGLPRHRGPGCDAGAVEVQVQPDALIRRGQGPFIGDGTYNLTAADQTIDAVLRRGVTVRFAVRVQNDGEQAADLVVRANPGRGPLRARYFIAGAEVTDAVVAGHPIPLAPGASAVVGMRVTVDPSAPHGLVRRFTAGVGLAPGAPLDRVRARVQVA